MRKASTRILRTVARNVRRLRQEMGLSQEGLASRCDLHRTFVGSIERAERNVTLSTLEALSGSLGVSVTDLLTETDNASKTKET